MRVPDSGLNKPFDRILKAFVDEAPEMFLRLLGMVGPEESVEITPLRPESSPPVVMPDFVAALALGSGDPFIFHVEFLTVYHSGIASTMARYGGSLACQYRRPVSSVLMLLRPQGVPQTVHEVGEFEIGVTRIIHPFRAVKMWEIDPAVILRTADWRLLPWALLMKSSDEDVRRVAAIVGRDGDEESIARFLTLGSLRYDRGWLEEILGASKMGLIEAILEGSSIIREVKEKAVRDATAESRVAEARRMLGIVLKARFPGLEASTDLEAIASAEALEALVQVVATSRDRARVEQALSAALRPN